MATAYQVNPNTLLARAGYLQLPGLQSLLDSPPSESELNDLLIGASHDEKRELMKHLAAIRTTALILEDLMTDSPDRGVQ